jgi:hypothetical protein
MEIAALFSDSSFQQIVIAMVVANLLIDAIACVVSGALWLVKGVFGVKREVPNDF